MVLLPAPDGAEITMQTPRRAADLSWGCRGASDGMGGILVWHQGFYQPAGVLRRQPHAPTRACRLGKKRSRQHASLGFMSAPLRKRWTQEQFFSWAAAREGHYEFDGFEPVDMTGGTVNHSLITRNLHDALRLRLRGSLCQNLGPDAGVATIDEAIRYPDALVTCARLIGTARTVPGVVVTFDVLSASTGEVLSASTGRCDRIVKVREYAAVPSIRRYVILESTGVGLAVFERPDSETPWVASTLGSEDEVLRLPEIGIAIPVAEIYAGIGFEAEVDPV